MTEMSKPDCFLNYNDGVDCYQNIAHSAGVHLEPLRTQSRSEIQEQLDRIEEAKSNINDPERVQKMNRLKNYLLECMEEVEDA